MNDRSKMLKESIEHYRWLLQTKLTMAERKTARAMFGRKQQELKEQQSKRHWFRALLSRL